jgi:hypothetical protein
MKIFLTSAMLLFLTLSAILSAQHSERSYSSDICIGYEEGFEGDILTYLKYKMDNINQMISIYEYERSQYKVNFDYHVGYISGQYDAYRDISNRINR